MGSINKKYYRSKNDNEVIIRNAKPEDAGEIISINRSVIDEKVFMLREPEEANYTNENTSKDIENHLNNPGSIYIVAEVNSAVVGFLEFQNGGLKRTSHSGVFSMFILKEFRNSGIGKFLLEELMNWAEANPLIEKITLAVFSTNERAIGLYKRSGFKEEGRCPKDMRLRDGTYIDSILMYKFV